MSRSRRIRRNVKDALALRGWRKETSSRWYNVRTRWSVYLQRNRSLPEMHSNAWVWIAKRPDSAERSIFDTLNAAMSYADDEAQNRDTR